MDLKAEINKIAGLCPTYSKAIESLCQRYADEKLEEAAKKSDDVVEDLQGDWEDDETRTKETQMEINVASQIAEEIRQLKSESKANEIKCGEK